MVLTDFFEKSYCINLDRRPDRWEKVGLEFEKFGIKGVERYSAIDGNKIENRTTLLNGEIGILHTHLDLIKICKSNNFDNVLIFEDDVIFSDEVREIEKYINQVPKNWDMIYFGGNHSYGLPSHVNGNLYRLNKTVALQCVAINNSVFDEIIENLPKSQRQVDVFYWSIQQKGNCYGFLPNLTYQSQDFSDIQNKFVNYDYFLK
jgi:hypothetical protein